MQQTNPLAPMAPAESLEVFTFKGLAHILVGLGAAKISLPIEGFEFSRNYFSGFVYPTPFQEIGRENASRLDHGLKNSWQKYFDEWLLLLLKADRLMLQLCFADETLPIVMAKVRVSRHKIDLNRLGLKLDFVDSSDDIEYAVMDLRKTTRGATDTKDWLQFQ